MPALGLAGVVATGFFPALPLGFAGAATVGLRWTAAAVTLGVCVQALLRGHRLGAVLVELLPALAAACAMGLGGWIPGLLVLTLGAVPLPLLMATRLGAEARVREEQFAEGLGMAALGPLAVLLSAQPLGLLCLIPLGWALRQGGASRGELVQHRMGRTQLREEREQLVSQARTLDRAAQEQAERAEALQARAEALEMLEQLSSRELTEQEALGELLRAVTQRLPGCSCGIYGPDLARLAGVGDRRPKAQTLADGWAARRRWLNVDMEGTEVLWPFARRGIFWLWSPGTLSARGLLTLETFAGYSLLLVERARHQQGLRDAWERETALREELDAAVIRLRRLGQLAPELARADAARDVLQQGHDFARWLTRHSVCLQALGMTLGAQPVQPAWSAPLALHGGMWVEGPAVSQGEEEALGLLALLLGAALERIQANAGLVQATKMAAIGQLAAGVAHELNTPLGALSIAIDVAMQSVESRPDRAYTRLETSLQAIERMRAIISKLLYYSRESGSGRRRLSMAAVAQDTLPLVNHAFQLDNVELRLELEDVEVSVDPGEIQQVIINLLVNAKLAVLSPGAHGREVVLRVAPVGTEVLVEVRDTGPGLDPAIADRIFEPFFTTREVGQGTGLGLSISQQIVRSHGGTLTWAPVEGGGTAFRMVLPR